MTTILDRLNHELESIGRRAQAALVNTDRAGLRLLYVTITRATKTLTVVHAEPLPEALEVR